ncbi:MAG: hypothetical protein EOP53_22320 [Sphingobacteriales bacterium]|nr:MAG: hypothetical protein EOP53_22320 [Sphingobacteriales bacterium]
MADYTSLMLYISGLEEEKDRIAEVNSFANNDYPFSLLDVNNTNVYPDAFPRFLYVGTYKNFDLPSFLKFLQYSVRWEYPEYVQLFVQQENDCTMSVYNNAGAELAVESKRE